MSFQLDVRGIIGFSKFPHDRTFPSFGSALWNVFNLGNIERYNLITFPMWFTDEQLCYFNCSVPQTHITLSFCTKYQCASLFLIGYAWFTQGILSYRIFIMRWGVHCFQIFLYSFFVSTYLVLCAIVYSYLICPSPSLLVHAWWFLSFTFPNFFHVISWKYHYQSPEHWQNAFSNAMNQP